MKREQSSQVPEHLFPFPSLPKLAFPRSPPLLSLVSCQPGAKPGSKQSNLALPWARVRAGEGRTAQPPAPAQLLQRAPPSPVWTRRVEGDRAPEPQASCGLEGRG